MRSQGATVLSQVTKTVEIGRSVRGVLVAIVLMSAFVGGVGVAAAAVPQAKTVPAKQWTASACKDFARWETRLTALSSRGALADPAAGKAAITNFLKGASKAADRLAKGVESAGVPKVKDGAAIAAVLRSSVKRLRAAYATAKTGAAALPTGDAAAFATAAQALGAQLQTASAALTTTLAETATRSPGGALDTAFTTTKACAALT